MKQTSDLPIVRPADVTPEWMTQLMRLSGFDVTVESVAGRKVGTGQVGESIRFSLGYRGDRKGAPTTIVGKFPSSNKASRASGATFGTYIREVNFYRHMAANAGITTPKCFYADIDTATCDFILLMEDLAPAVQGDQIEGVSLQQAALVLDEAAKLHASHWADDRMDDLEWLYASKAAPILVTQDYMRTVWGGFRQRYGEQITPDCIAIGEAISQNYDFYRFGYTGPRCLIHNDFRPDNMMFGTASGGYPLAVVDWQMLGYGCCMADVSYFLGGALSREQRRENERALLGRYHRKLFDLGVSGYSFDAAWADYARYSFSLFIMAFSAAMVVERTPRGDNMFLSMLRGGADHVMDLDALSCLPH